MLLLLGFPLLICFCEDAETTTTTLTPAKAIFSHRNSTRSSPTTPPRLIVVLAATPDYPVTAGQKISIRCAAGQVDQHFTWFWFHNLTWQVIANGSELILTKPEQSGNYTCKVEGFGNEWSEPHWVFIVATQMTLGEKLGIAAFVLSLFTFVITLAILFWMCWERLDPKVFASKAAIKSFPGPGMTSKGGSPGTESERDVYMNYTNTNQAYSDLDPSSMTDCNVYDSLS